MKEHSMHRVFTGRYSVKKILLFILFVLLLLLGGFHMIVTAKAESVRPSGTQYYDCYMIKGGDTLWEIAESHTHSAYPTTAAYVRAIMDCNGLETDQIHAGMNLIIPYTE